MTIKVNGKPIKSFNFSGGECHVSIAGIETGAAAMIEAYLYSADDIMRLIMTVDAVRQINPETVIDLTIPYFPYARQDRVCNPGEAFGAAVMAHLINGLNARSVTVLDPHSPVVEAYLKNTRVITQAELVKGTVANFIKREGLTLVSPDKGASKKTDEIGAALGGVQVLHCAKVRDPATGKITHAEVHGDASGKDMMILDDICDGGGTFIELAKILKAQGAGRLYLYVTHGIFSKGLDILKEHFAHVFCVHTFLRADQIDTDFLTVTGKENSDEN